MLPSSLFSIKITSLLRLLGTHETKTKIKTISNPLQFFGQKSVDDEEVRNETIVPSLLLINRNSAAAYDTRSIE